ncbi:MAG: DNA mismatch repair protein MutS, partial [Spirochaetales bacterium]|nr:DNA mismatch repair protein MutS [Spirochaetales bacterium]
MSTPMMQQYRRIKQEHGDSVLFFRMGDFYEMFEKDAKEVSALLNLTLTSRHGIPMCGLPYHAAQSYISRLLRAGKKVAICEQTSLPRDGKGIAERRVVEIVTPGTVVEENYLDKNSNNYLVSVGRTQLDLAISSLDLSTGEFLATSVPWEERSEALKRELTRLSPKEILIQESLFEEDEIVGRIVREYPNLMINRFPDWHFDLDTSRELLKKQFGVSNLKGFGITDDDAAILPTGALLEYVEDTSKSLLRHILNLRIYRETEFLGLDESTLRNLEIVRNLQDGSRQFTLVDVLDYTRSSMGSRMLKHWLLNPLNDISRIEERLEKVETLYRNQLLLSSIRENLSAILDLERLSARIALDKAHAKDLQAVRQTLAAAESVEELVVNEFGTWSKTSAHREKVLKVFSLIDRAIHDDPSILLTEGRLIKTGYNEELDELRGIKKNRQEILDAYLREEKDVSGIGNLRIKYNKIIGYYLEVTKSNL